jgi:hypothetical protein
MRKAGREPKEVTEQTRADRPIVVEDFEEEPVELEGPSKERSSSTKRRTSAQLHAPEAKRAKAAKERPISMNTFQSSPVGAEGSPTRSGPRLGPLNNYSLRLSINPDDIVPDLTAQIQSTHAAVTAIHKSIASHIQQAIFLEKTAREFDKAAREQIDRAQELHSAAEHLLEAAPSGHATSPAQHLVDYLTRSNLISPVANQRLARGVRCEVERQRNAAGLWDLGMKQEDIYNPLWRLQSSEDLGAALARTNPEVTRYRSGDEESGNDEPVGNGSDSDGSGARESSHDSGLDSVPEDETADGPSQRDMAFLCGRLVGDDADD